MICEDIHSLVREGGHEGGDLFNLSQVQLVLEKWEEAIVEISLILTLIWSDDIAIVRGVLQVDGEVLRGHFECDALIRPQTIDALLEEWVGIDNLVLVQI